MTHTSFLFTVTIPNIYRSSGGSCTVYVFAEDEPSSIDLFVCDWFSSIIMIELSESSDTFSILLDVILSVSSDVF